MPSRGGRFFAVAVSYLALFTTLGADGAQAADRIPAISPVERPRINRGLLTSEQWRTLDRTVARGIEFISKNQSADGSFRTLPNGQPGVTSLCIMAMLACGHQPGRGPFGDQIERAIDFVLDMQDPRVGSLMLERWNGDEPPYSNQGHYNHGIAGIMLGEVYGMTTSVRHERIRNAILKALEYTRRQQIRPKSDADLGGWRYTQNESTGIDSDLSVTAWQLMFLRSARNAEFNVPREWVTDALGYVHRTFDVNRRAFVYALGNQREEHASRGMVGAGIVCLELSGEHGSETARAAGSWILRSSFRPYGQRPIVEDRYHYSAFYCSQAMFQLGGEYWHRFFPDLLAVLSENQHADGSFDDDGKRDTRYGTVYTTALVVLALTPPYQLLPLYQR